jgi:hypothetical protein
MTKTTGTTTPEVSAADARHRDHRTEAFASWVDPWGAQRSAIAQVLFFIGRESIPEGGRSYIVEFTFGDYTYRVGRQCLTIAPEECEWFIEDVAHPDRAMALEGAFEVCESLLALRNYLPWLARACFDLCCSEPGRYISGDKG